MSAEKMISSGQFLANGVVRDTVIASSLALPVLQSITDFLPSNAPWWAFALIGILGYVFRQTTHIVAVIYQHRATEAELSRQHSIKLAELESAAAAVEAEKDRDARAEMQATMLRHLDRVSSHIVEMHDEQRRTNAELNGLKSTVELMVLSDDGVKSSIAGLVK